MPESRLRVVLGWHMHQPEYRDPTTGAFLLPWSYLHAIKDYADMAAHLEAIPEARAVVNFVPLLLDQLQDYAGRIEAHLAHGKAIGDEMLDALASGSVPADVDTRLKWMAGALRAHPERLIGRYTAYRRLASEAERLQRHPDECLDVPDVFFHDLITWFHLAWMGETVKQQDEFVRLMIAQQRAYGLEDRRALLRRIGELCAGIVPRYRALAERGQIELSVTPYGHPILPLLLDFNSAHEAMPMAPLPERGHYPDGEARALRHLQHGIEAFQQHFGMAPQGCWCSEGSVSNHTLSLLDQCGFRWTATGQQVLNHSAHGPAPADRPYLSGKHQVRCFFRDDDLSDRIGFRYSIWHGEDAARDLVDALVTIARSDGNRRVVTIFLDGENAWEHYPANGAYFLPSLYRQLVDHPELELCTFSEALDGHVETGSLPQLVAGSWVYGTFSTWIGSADKNRAWELLVDAKQAWDKAMAEKRLDAAARERAEQQLSICESSDWFWWLGSENPAAAVSDFERLYRAQLKRLYQLIGVPAPAALDTVLSHGQGDPAVGGTMKPGSEGHPAQGASTTTVSLPHPLLSQRRAGVLAHITSMPGPLGHGDFSHGSWRFIEFLQAAGFGLWQVLPMGPTHSDGSPYLSLSANAGNPMLISLDWLKDRGWLDGFNPHAQDPHDERRRCLVRACEGFDERAGDEARNWFKTFCRSQADWLDDYALFVAIRNERDHQGWTQWPAPLRDREPAALAEARARLAREIDQQKFEQFIFFAQWTELRRYAHEHGVQIFGDLPLFVAHDSADVWSHRELFCVDATGKPLKIAGVPPDYFAEDGQVWGNPLYDWACHEREDFAWWIRRMRTQLALYDVIRIDHFRGLSSYWEIPAGETTARNGRWVPAPGEQLLATLLAQLHPLPLVAEDLGDITPDVFRLRDRFSLPGMRVLQFGFDGDPHNLHLPHNVPVRSVIYTGTHDNATTVEWWASLAEDVRSEAGFHFNHRELQMPWPAVYTALGSCAHVAVVPMQDLLGLGKEARMNTPGTVHGNWSWQFRLDQIPGDLAGKLRDINWRYGRMS